MAESLNSSNCRYSSSILGDNNDKAFHVEVLMKVKKFLDDLVQNIVI